MRMVAVLLEKVVRHRLERAPHALADRHARHHHHELQPAVAPVQLQHRPDVGVGLARARLHLHGQEGRVPVLESPRPLQAERGRKPVGLLPRTHAVQQLRFRKPRRPVSERVELLGIHVLPHRRLPHRPRVLKLVGERHGRAVVPRVFEASGHGLHGVQLELLLDEFQFHGSSLGSGYQSSQSSMGIPSGRRPRLLPRPNDSLMFTLSWSPRLDSSREIARGPKAASSCAKARSILSSKLASR